MDPDTACTIRYATPDDVPALRRLLERDNRRAFCGPALVAEVRGVLGAAISLADGQVIADPAQPTSVLTQLLRMCRTDHPHLDASTLPIAPRLAQRRSQESRSGADGEPHPEGAYTARRRAATAGG